MRKPSPRRKTKEERLNIQLNKMDSDGIQLLINQLQKKGGQSRVIKQCEDILMAKALRNVLKSTVTVPLRVLLGTLALSGRLAIKGVRKLI